MKVLVISEHYFPILGGSTTYVYNLCKNIASLNCEVYLVTIPDDKNPVLEWYKEENFWIYRLKIPKILIKERYFPFFLSLKIKDILNHVEPDVMHFAHGFFVPLITILNKRVKEKPIVWTIQNIPPYEHSLNIFENLSYFNRILESVYRVLADFYGHFVLGISKFDYLICVSENTGKLALERDVPKNKIIILQNGVDTNFFAPRDDKAKIKDDLDFQENEKIILTVSGIIPHKGLDYLVKSIPKVLEKHPDTLFLVIGPVRSRNFFLRLKTLIDDLKIVDTIKIVEGVDFDDINKYYAISDVYILPSLEEGRNISVLEAMSSGLPVVGTETSLRFKDEIPCLKIEERNPDQIAHAIIKLLDNPKYAGELGKNARGYIQKNLSWNKIAEETLDLYNILLNQR